MSNLRARKTVLISTLLAIAFSGVLIVYGMQRLTVQSKGPDYESIPFKTLYCCSAYSDSYQNLVINDNNTWSSVYTNTFCRPYGCNPSINLTIDFASVTVLAVFAGREPTGGYDINITQVGRNGSNIIAQVQSTSPESHCITAKVLTYPAHLVTIPKTEMPVTFNVKSVQVYCA